MYEHANREITCLNTKYNKELTFTERKFDPFLLVKANGIYDVSNNISKSNNVVIAGATYLGSVMEARNIVLTIKDIDNYEQNRELVDQVFQNGVLGILTVKDGEHIRNIEYYTESIESTATVGKRLTTISLICPDPYFYDPNENVVNIATMTPHFEWPHEFVAEGEEFSFQNPSRTGVIENETAEENTGMTMVVTVTDTVKNPQIVKIQTQEFLQMGEDGHDFYLYRGDVLTITTHTGNKNILLTRNGETSGANHHMTADSVFFQLSRGTNTIGYNADEGRNAIMIQVSYRNRFVRA